MFIFTMIVGLLGLIAWNEGLGTYFIILFIISVIINELDLYLKSKDYNDAISEFMEAFNQKANIETKTNEQNEKAKQAAKALTTESFLKKKQIPVRIDKETGAYIISVDELIQAVDSYYASEINDMFKDNDKNGNK